MFSKACSIQWKTGEHKPDGEESHGIATHIADSKVPAKMLRVEPIVMTGSNW